MLEADERAERVRRAADAATRLAATALLNEHRRARQAGLSLHSVDAVVLGLLRLHGPLTPRELAGHAGITSSGTMTGAIDRLEHAGWTARTPCRVDRRKVFVTLTDAAAQMQPPMFADALARCTDQQLADLTELLGALCPASREPDPRRDRDA